MQRKLLSKDKQADDLATHKFTTHELKSPCFENPRSFFNSMTKKFFETLDTYLLFFGMIIAFIIGTQWTQCGAVLGKLYTHEICVALMFLILGLKLKSEEIIAGLSAYKAFIWSLLSILFIVPSLGIQITKTIHFATLSDENISTSYSHVEANVSAIGPTEFAIGLEVFFGVPASVASGTILAAIAGGNSAFAILVMLVTNTAGAFSVPPLLAWMTSVDTSDVTYKGYALLVGIFVLTVVVPAMVGQVMRFISRLPDGIDNNPRILRYIVIVLFVISTLPLISQSTTDNDKYHSIVKTNTMAILGFTTIMHFIFLLLNWVACGLLKVGLPLKKTAVILASHKAIEFAMKTIEFLPESAGSRDLMRIACVIAYLLVLGIDCLIVCKVATIDEDPLDHIFTDEEKYKMLPMGE